jgi:hypothetical protein
MRTRTAFLFVAVVAILGCGEKPQTKAAHKPDAQPWTGAQDPYVAPGWKAGDQASWEQQMQKRAQGQNEYARTPVTQP